MTKPAISVIDLTKKFKVWERKPQRDFKAKLNRMFSLNFLKPDPVKYVTILNNINFDIFPGEFVGIMGRNGVGKSTILKLISQVYFPTEGSVLTHGKVAPLLELGAGFQEDLTGYENIFLNASILGFSKTRTVKSLDDIIDFSGLREKINMPVRNYSSGMLVRLGFSIAVHLDSPILLLDEVLGVGDAEFIRKSTQKIHELHTGGRTIVLVTHSPEQIKKHCTRCIVIEKTGVVFDGCPKEGAEKYLNILS